jgi:hypothetical protein
MNARQWLLPGVLILASVALVAAAVGIRANSPQSESEHWLLAQNSRSAEFTGNGDGAYTLTLKDPDPKLVAFTDRPRRVASVVPLEAIVEEWSSMFGDDPPNAAITDTDRGAGFFPVTLNNPRWAGADLVFTAKPIPDPNGTVREPPTRMSDVSTLIDAAVIDPDDYSINYSLDGDYAKFNLAPGGQAGGYGFCYSDSADDCIYVPYDGDGQVSTPAS